MTELRAQQLSSLYRDIAALQYEHPEGAAYVYVRFLSLLRDVPALIADKKEASEIGELQRGLNLALASRFSDAQHRFFIDAQRRVLRMMKRQLERADRLAAAVAAL